MSLGDSIKEVRIKSLMSQTDFANELGVAFTTVNRWENGRSVPNISDMKTIKKFCTEKGHEYKNIENAWITDRIKK